uniref:Uncharacterized protein n=1 Tax=Desulfovibrio sp. U5L TaxID=596152 RepID=I2PY93_9BACT
MRQTISTVADVKQMIEAGRKLLLAGDEDALSQLPKGDWIAGTIPYFISSDQGGMVSRDMICTTDITDLVASIDIVAYDQNSLARVYAEGPKHGFSFIIIPAFSKAHRSFALNAPNYKDFGVRPLIGWVAGVHLGDLGKKSPKVMNGRTGDTLEEGALVLQAMLPEGKVAEIGIINLFEQGDGDILTFTSDDFSAKDVMVNGEKRNLAAYIVKNKLDTKLPLVADYYGALVNISVQDVDEVEGQVKFYAPVFTGIRYKHAKPVADYVKVFNDRLSKECAVDSNRVAFSCNCILNYLYSELEGKKTDPFTGPVTFGEIAYQLLNQTLVYLEIMDV